MFANPRYGTVVDGLHGQDTGGIELWIFGFKQAIKSLTLKASIVLKLSLTLSIRMFPALGKAGCTFENACCCSFRIAGCFYLYTKYQEILYIAVLHWHASFDAAKPIYNDLNSEMWIVST